MMDWTDRHCRFFHRLMTRHALLYTEMVTSAAVVHGQRARLIGFDPAEQPVAAQLGGADPRGLAEAARICADFGYREINLNVGCPSDRVQDGRFGACLMREPALVADCVAAMKRAANLPVTVKCRIGVDDQDPRAALFDMAGRVTAAGADAILVHARQARVPGLPPRKKRGGPPLHYPLVYELKQAFPATPIAINGGIASIGEARAHLAHVDGVMLGRAAYHDPEILLSVDPDLFGTPAPVADAHEAVEAFIPYIEARLAEGVRLSSMTRHMLGLFAGRPGARAFRRHLAVEAVKPGAGVDVLRAAVAEVDRATRARAA